MRIFYFFEKIKISLRKKTWVFFNTKLLKVSISKIKNRPKNIIYAKNEQQFNSNLLSKFGHF